jgi:hypothetical protein
MNDLKDTSEVKLMIRGYFVDFLKEKGKGISNNEFEMLSQFENYIVKRMEKN